MDENKLTEYLKAYAVIFNLCYEIDGQTQKTAIQKAALQTALDVLRGSIIECTFAGE